MQTPTQSPMERYRDICGYIRNAAQELARAADQYAMGRALSSGYGDDLEVCLSAIKSEMEQRETVLAIMRRHGPERYGGSG